MTGPEFDDAVDAFLRANVVPRRPEPRLADALAAIEMQRVASSQGDVAAWRVGEGPAVLLVHGWEDNNALWSPLIDALLERERALVAFDLPAHGFSEGEWGLGTAPTDAIFAVTDALGPVDAVVAHSFAAGATTFALNGGVPAERAVYIAPILRNADRWQMYAERLGVSEDVAVAARAKYNEHVGPELAAFNLRAALPTLATDLLVVQSRDDERSPFADTEAVIANCPRARLVAVEGLAHRRTARDPGVVRLVAAYVT